MTTVLIVDDQTMIRMGLRSILETQPDIDLVADVSSGFEALSVLNQHPVDVVLLDLRMPAPDGVEVTRRIRAEPRWRDVRIIILTTFDQEDNVLAAIRAGANGFLSKAVTPTELIGAIRDVAAGQGALSGAAAAMVIQQVAEADTPEVDAQLAARFGALTPREQSVVACIAAGMSNSEIAKKLFISPFTVKTHASRAMTKLGARDRAQLAALAHRSGLPEYRR